MQFKPRINIKNLKKNTITNTQAIVKSLTPGLGTSIPIILFEEIFTNLHYNENILNFELIELSIFLSFLFYNYDRFLDSLEKTNKNEKDILIEKNKNYIIFILAYCFLEINKILYQNEINYIFSIPLSTCFIYKDLKFFLGIYKPVFIAFMWTGACIFIPSILHDNSFAIIQDYLCYIPCLLTMFSTSNIADIKDIEEDTLANINTIPVKYGIDKTKLISLLSLFFSSILFLNHPNFNNNNNLDLFFEFQNLIIFVSILFGL